MTPLTLYRRNARGQVQTWTIGIDARGRVTREWGMQGGRMQRTADVIAPIRHKSVAVVTQEFITRQIKEKTDNGFVPSLGLIRESHLHEHEDMTFLDLPKSFAPQKPFVDPPSAEVLAQRSIIWQRKRDGQRHYVLRTTSGLVKLYSRHMEDMTEHMPRIVSTLEASRLPKGTVLDGEIIVDRHGTDDFRAVGEVCRSKPGRAAVAESRLPIRYMVFDVLYFRRQPIWRQLYRRRYDVLQDEIEWHDYRVYPVANLTDRFVQAQQWAREHNWEGLVGWDLDAPNVLRMDGTPARAGCWKWKPNREGDFIAMGWMPGKGRLSKTMGKLRIGEWRSVDVNPKIVEIGTVGSGFTNAMRDEAMHWTYPCVVTLTYDKQETDTRALRFPVFVRRHPDKKVKELK